MTKEHALFDDDFDFDFDDEPASGTDPLADLGIAADETPDVGGVDLDAPAKPVETMNAADLAMPANVSGGERPIPAISIQAFLEQPSTRELLETVARDRRLGRTTFEILEGGLEAAISHLSESATPNLLIVESHADARNMIAQIDALAEHAEEGVEVMVIGATNDIALYRQLVSRGVSEYLVPPIQPLQLIRSISDLFADPDAPFLGKSVAVVGAKGGVGASTIAHNLAWSMAENGRLNTTLVDLDVAFGTTALDFNEDPTQTVVDALLDPDRADESVISRLLAKATDRLSLFAAPASVADLPDIPVESYAQVISTVQRSVPFVVLDLPHVWSAWLRQTLVNSDEVVLVCQPDLASLRNGKNIIDQLTAERPNDAAPRLVLNMAGVPKRPEIPVKDFAAAIGIEPSIILPFEPHLFGMAANNGQMISETDATAKASLAIDHLSTLITGKSVEQTPKSLLQKLLGR